MIPRITIHLDLDDHHISVREVVDMANVLAEAYPHPGKYVSSFGFLTYEILREESGVSVDVFEGFGYHGLYGFEFNSA